MNLPPDAVITGSWDSEPIWRHKTAEERLLEQGVKKETLELAKIILGHKNGMEFIRETN